MSAATARRSSAPLHIATAADQPLAEAPPTLKARIRAHLATRDRLTAELAEVDGFLAADARRLANENGLTVRPRIEQLRHMIGNAE